MCEVFQLARSRNQRLSGSVAVAKLGAAYVCKARHWFFLFANSVKSCLSDAILASRLSSGPSPSVVSGPIRSAFSKP